jgi:hypothetical protein
MTEMERQLVELREKLAESEAERRFPWRHFVRGGVRAINVAECLRSACRWREAAVRLRHALRARTRGRRECIEDVCTGTQLPGDGRCSWCALAPSDGGVEP